MLYVICSITWLIWLSAIISLCTRRDIEIHRKLTWIVTVLVLNVIGALIYFIFVPSRAKTREANDFPIDPDSTPYTPPGESWNPILGVNPFPSGQGLNPKSEEEKR